MRIRPIVFAAVITVGLSVPRAWSQENASVTTVVTPTADVTVVTTAAEPDLIIHGAEPTENVATKGRSDSGADTLSVDFPDEDVRNILRNVADLFELNLVVPDTLQGRTSIKLRDVTWRQIFEVVLTPIGFTYVEDGNIIKIVSRDSLLQEPVATEVFILNYARAADIMPTLNPLIDGAAGGNIVIDARSNALVITERPSKMSRIRPIIEQLDKATDQVMIESKFVEVTDQDVKNIGVNWSSLAGMRLGVSNISQTWERGRAQDGSIQNNRNNSVGDSTDNEQINRQNSLTESNRVEENIDVPFMQNGFERADDVASRNNGSGGTNPSPNTGIGPAYTVDPETGAFSYAELGPSSTDNTENSTTFSDERTVGSSTSNTFENLIGLTNTTTQSRLASAVFSASDFEIIISALKTQNDTKLVSNPTVVTLNNTEAIINIGKEYPIPNYTYNQERGTYEVSGFNYRPIGIILKVTPQVNATGFIKLSIEPEVSSSTESAPFGATAIPIITTRKTKTQVSLKDGFTMGIGGLIENSNIVGQTRVPVLGSIPLLGRLFRSDSKNMQTRNLIIFITAKTVNAEGATVDEVFDPRRVRQLNMRQSDLPGYRDGSSPFITDEEAAAMAKKKH